MISGLATFVGVGGGSFNTVGDTAIPIAQPAVKLGFEFMFHVNATYWITRCLHADVYDHSLKNIILPCSNHSDVVINKRSGRSKASPSLSLSRFFKKNNNNLGYFFVLHLICERTGKKSTSIPFGQLQIPLCHSASICSALFLKPERRLKSTCAFSILFLH